MLHGSRVIFRKLCVFRLDKTTGCAAGADKPAISVTMRTHLGIYLMAVDQSVIIVNVSGGKTLGIVQRQ